jgi:hypothetical protein
LLIVLPFRGYGERLTLVQLTSVLPEQIFSTLLSLIAHHHIFSYAAAQGGLTTPQEGRRWKANEYLLISPISQTVFYCLPHEQSIKVTPGLQIFDMADLVAVSFIIQPMFI